MASCSGPWNPEKSSSGGSEKTLVQTLPNQLALEIRTGGKQKLTLVSVLFCRLYVVDGSSQLFNLFDVIDRKSVLQVLFL
jgi:hypothetical protein